MLEILRKELDTTMALTGVQDVTTVTSDILLRRRDGSFVGER
ncbi:alpha-hydroxy acid oxidase (plasmid) [Bradyrhizobium guangxiense]